MFISVFDPFSVKSDRLLANLHGGSLSIDSTLGVGTTVTIRLPALRVVHQRMIAAL